ncbi:MAG: hypothetical protein WA705_13165 [Candidatus Ozemobacteraceae bacterium]
MEDLLRRLEFRPFSYEADPDSLVDMHRCREILEGSWLDDIDTCRMHHKMVTRACGSSWVIVVAKAIIGYADLVGMKDGSGVVCRWRLHSDFHHPRVAARLFQGLKEQAKIRSLNSLTFFADHPEVLTDLEEIGIKRDRSYQWIRPDQEEELGPEAPSATLNQPLSDFLEMDFRPFLGSPLAPGFLLARSFLAAEYGVFHHCKPLMIEITVDGVRFPACHDGREWFVFRTAKRPGDAQAIRPILANLAKNKPGRILMTQKAIELAKIIPASEEIFWDLYTDIEAGDKGDIKS